MITLLKIIFKSFNVFKYRLITIESTDGTSLVGVGTHESIKRLTDELWSKHIENLEKTGVKGD